MKTPKQGLRLGTCNQQAGPKRTKSQNEFSPNREQAGCSMLDCAGGLLPATVTQSPTQLSLGLLTPHTLKCYRILSWTGQETGQAQCQRGAWWAWQDRSISRICVSKADWIHYRRLQGRKSSLQETAMHLSWYPHTMSGNSDLCFPKSFILKLINFLRREIKIFSTKNIFASKDTCHFSYSAI